jgi:multidrug resistance efflux pump
MGAKHKYFELVILLAMGVTLVGCDALPGMGGASAGLSASGVVETVEVAVSPELAGRVAEVHVDKGDAVQPGDALFRLQDEVLEAQRQQAVLALESAEAALVTARTGLRMAESTLGTAQVNAEAASAEAEIELLASQQALDDLYKNADIIKAEAQRAVSEANQAVRDAQYQLDNFTVPIEHKDMTAMQAVEVMWERLDEARQAFEPYKYYSSGNQTRKDLKEDLDEAQSDYDSAVKRLRYETQLEGALAVLDKAQRDLAAVQDGPDPDDVALLEARIAAARIAPERAQAVVEQAEVGLTQAQAGLVQAEKTVAQAQANLDLIDIQVDKLIVRSAVSGVVMARNVQPGEVIQPGLTAMTVGQLERLTVTVYISEDRYGQISLGDNAQVTTDSFPGMTFKAEVTRIADRAEYTPRNVQTQEDRATTVFAIELAVEDPDGKLKPGMPVDVDF